MNMSNIVTNFDTVLTFCLLGAKSSHETMLTYWQLDYREWNSTNFEKDTKYIFNKMHLQAAWNIPVIVFQLNALVVFFNF